MLMFYRYRILGFYIRIVFEFRGYFIEFFCFRGEKIEIERG